MVFNQIDHGLSGNYTYVDAVNFAGLFQQIAEVVSH
jgi:hypothetical protein